jgi:TolB-like protein/Tfp pilus assembly protein PilF
VTDDVARLTSALAERYAIERELGAGGMATVYLARDLRHDRAVALKVLRPELGQVLGPDRFLREIRTTAQLAHPHILPLHDSGEAAGFLYYVMPFVEGETLRDRLTREKQLPLEEALRITRAVADALGYAHSLGLVHRDIKPENILFEAGHAVVADFGIAKAIASAGSSRLTETGLAIGTPAYMSPEQAAGSQDVDGRSDLYSLGCVLYEMLAGQPPFTGPTADSVVRQHLAADPPSITVVRPAVPTPVAAALQRVLAKTAADRFTTAARFAEALAHPEATGAVLKARRPAWWRRRAVRLAAAAVVLILIAGAVDRWWRPGALRSRQLRTAIAVMPLTNFSAEGPHSYFAGGLHDELITQLAKVAALTVIGRTSALTYAGSTKRLSQIGQELAVGSIVEGSVQVDGNRLRVNVQLIDPATEKNLWAEHYDRTLDDAFAVQSEIAQKIVEVVGATLTRAEAGAIAAAPTANPEAYRLYLQGEEYRRRAGYDRRNLESAQPLLERALALDPGFALAHASLSFVHGAMYFLKFDPYPARAELQRREAETALRLAPDLPQAHWAMGVAYTWGPRDVRRALEEMRRAAEKLPGSAELRSWIGMLHRGVGEWDQALAAFEQAKALDPRDALLFEDLGSGTYQALRRYREAVAAMNQALALAPDAASDREVKAYIYFLWQGQLDTLRSVLEQVPEDSGGSTDKLFWRVALALWERRPDALLALLPDPQRITFEAQDNYTPAWLLVAWAQQLRGDSAAARRAFIGALGQVDSALRNLPYDWRLHAARGIALAGLGRRAEARTEAESLKGSVLYRSAFFGPSLTDARAMIFAQAGLVEEALGEIEQLLSRPSPWESVQTFRLDPRWDPIRHDPRFQALLTKYAGR